MRCSCLILKCRLSLISEGNVVHSFRILCSMFQNVFDVHQFRIKTEYSINSLPKSFTHIALYFINLHISISISTSIIYVSIYIYLSIYLSICRIYENNKFLTAIKNKHEYEACNRQLTRHKIHKNSYKIIVHVISTTKDVAIYLFYCTNSITEMHFCFFTLNVNNPT